MILRAILKFPITRQAVILACLCLTLPITGTAFGQNQAETQGEGSKSPYEQCSDKAQAEMPRIFDCQHIELDRVDDALNRTYQQLRRSLPPPRFRKLQIEERAWLKRVDRTCKKEGGGLDALGQDSQFFWLSCMIRETDVRLSALEALLATDKSKPSRQVPASHPSLSAP